MHGEFWSTSNSQNRNKLSHGRRMSTNTSSVFLPLSWPMGFAGSPLPSSFSSVELQQPGFVFLSLVSCWATCSAHGNTYLFSLCLISPKIGQRQSLKSLAKLSEFPGLEVEPVPAALRDAEMKAALGNCPYFSFLLLFFVFFSSYCFKPWNLIFWLQEYLIKVLHEVLLVPGTPHGISWQQGTPDLCFASVPVNFLF